MTTHLRKILYVEAAHRNPRGGTAQRRLHGHSYKVEVLASGAPDPEIGWIADFAELKRLFQPLYDQLDHALLNDLPGLEEDTTLPALRRWIEARLDPRPDWLDGVQVSIAGDLAFAPRRLPPAPEEGLPERWRFTFEAAQALAQLPSGHPCTAIHGHSYRIEAAADDLPGLEAHLRALYDALDHRFLNEVPGLEQATCERLCQWMWEWLAARGARMQAVVVQETPTARSLYFGA